MINKFLKKKFFHTLILLFFCLITNQQYANEILIYADNISYDKENNIIAKGKAKILYENNIISSDLIIYSQSTGNINLPIEFSLKDREIITILVQVVFLNPILNLEKLKMLRSC
jgi:lipopolysaccharide assembly outer membrane protein LptD (OstA)